MLGFIDTTILIICSVRVSGGVLFSGCSEKVLNLHTVFSVPVSYSDSPHESCCKMLHVVSNKIKRDAESVNVERTLIMIKPDGVQRGLIGEVIRRFEQKGFKMVAMKMAHASQKLLEDHYADHRDKDFYDDLIGYVSSGPVVPMVWEGIGAVKSCRKMIGATNPSDASRGTIRGDLAVASVRNLIHGSHSVESANREIDLWFGPKELVRWKRSDRHWIDGNTDS
ncbi:awd (predicted) [Pycnogonum litorale]